SSPLRAGSTSRESSSPSSASASKLRWQPSGPNPAAPTATPGSAPHATASSAPHPSSSSSIEASSLTPDGDDDEPTPAPAADPDAEEPLLGTVLGERYRIDARIGAGGMGLVY